MLRYLFITVLIIVALTYWSNPKELTSEMKEMATNTVIDHLKVNDLPYDNLTLSESKNRDIADYAVIYTGGGHCIEFIVVRNDQ